MTRKGIIACSLPEDDRPSSGSFEAPLGRLQNGEPRRRKWATKARTGCITCRIRRIKCDETRPVCKRCIRGRLNCQGYELPDPGDFNRATGCEDGCLRPQQLRKSTVCPEFEPFDWEFQQSLQYFFQVRVPEMLPGQRMPNMRAMLEDPLAQKAMYMHMVSDWLQRAAKARGKALCPGEDPAFESIWMRHHRNAIANINDTNDLIQNNAKYNNEAPATLTILQLLYCDLETGLKQWRAHLGGFHAYVKFRGGASHIMTLPKPEKSRLSPVMSITMQSNTTCPADMQIKDSDNFSDDEIRTLIAFDPTMVEPCPTDFHLARVRITRLRVALARKTKPSTSSKAAGLDVTGRTGRLQITSARSPPRDCKLQVQQIFDTIWHFNLNDWIEEEFHDKSDDRREEAKLMGPLYAVAIRLYGILTLPKRAVAAWALSSPEIKSAHPMIPGCSVYESVRRQHKDELLKMLHEARGQAKLQKWLAWPFLVLGVALADDTWTDKKFVEEWLSALWKTNPHVSVSFITVVEKLRLFWLMGKTEWEECFDEPVPFAIT